MNKLRAIFSYFQSGNHIDPTRDWFVLLSLAAIIFAGLIGWNAWAFDTVASGGNIGGPAPKSTPLFDASTLDAIHALFETRAAEEAKYRTGVYRYTDPSQ
jgi:hypothetical protein